MCSLKRADYIQFQFLLAFLNFSNLQSLTLFKAYDMIPSTFTTETEIQTLEPIIITAGRFVARPEPMAT